MEKMTLHHHAMFCNIIFCVIHFTKWNSSDFKRCGGRCSNVIVIDF